MTPIIEESKAPRDIEGRLEFLLSDHRCRVDQFGIDPSEAARLGDDIQWLTILNEAFQHEPMLIVAMRGNRYAGHVALCVVRSALFGRFLVSLPFLNSAGISAADADVAVELAGQAASLADQHDVKFLELRHDRSVGHPALAETLTSKVHMRLALPETRDDLMASLKSKRRSQLKNGLGRGFDVRWGGLGLVDDFYSVFSRNMRDLGTPVYGRQLFRSILTHLQRRAELCCLYDGDRAVAGALLVHCDSERVTEVPSASALRNYHPTNVNMAMYWHLLQRAISRGQRMFDFGRSTVDGPTFAFKKQWGAQPTPAVWQYYVRKGTIDVGRPDNGRYGMAIRAWKKLPVWTANMLGPFIVRGIP